MSMFIFFISRSQSQSEFRGVFMPAISHDLEYTDVLIKDRNFDACHFLSQYVHPVFSHHDPELPHLSGWHINFSNALS